MTRLQIQASSCKGQQQLKMKKSLKYMVIVVNYGV